MRKLRKRVPKEEQIRLINECRKSGLSDYQWCEKNGVYPGTFYNWVSKLRKSGYNFTESEVDNCSYPTDHEVVKVDLVECHEAVQMAEQNDSLSALHSSAAAAEILIGNVTLRLFNGADEQLIQNTLRCIGGMKHDW